MKIRNIVFLAALATGCTKQTPQSFQLLPVTDNFNTATAINTQIDMLWVIDNSASMDNEQNSLRIGLSAFASKYLQPTWDIRIGVITTDSYVANSAFQPWLQTTVSGSPGWVSPYISSRLSTWKNPSWDSSLLNLQTGAFTSGFTYNDEVHAFGPNYARLMAGIHDGPTTALCSEADPYFFSGTSQCKIRDDQTKYSGPSHCLSPASGESAITQCVNTLENDTVHSGQPVISTLPPAGTAGDSAWVTQITQNFMINASVGTSGIGSQRGFGSLSQFLSDNETGPSPYFRPGSVRVIVFVSDADDQTQVLPSSPPSGFNPFTGYLTNCPSKTVDSYTYTIASCPNPASLVAVSTVKAQLDSFFQNLDGNASGTTSYIVVPVTPLAGTSIQTLQAQRSAEDSAVAAGDGNLPNCGALCTSVDRGDRYLALMNLVGQGSFSSDLASSNYSQFLESLGQAMIEKRASFTLSRTPSSTEDLVVVVNFSDGSSEAIPSASYVVTGTTLTITDNNLILSFSQGDSLSVTYQPKTVL